tara:strand:+ start:514 stop:813 length:300 start_codon:yes stop_codon:yes gene_type:complete
MSDPNTFRDLALAEFQSRAKVKYDKGQQEHGGFLPDRATIDDAIDECIDNYFYLLAVRYRLERTGPQEGTLAGSIMQTNADKKRIDNPPPPCENRPVGS